MSDVSDTENQNPLLNSKAQQDIDEAVKKGETNFRIQQDANQIVEEAERRLKKAERKERLKKITFPIDVEDPANLRTIENINKPVEREKTVSKEEIIDSKIVNIVTPEELK